MSLAAGKHVDLAISVPCIELWLILHYRDQHAYLSIRAAQHAAKDLTGCGKNLDEEVLDHLAAEYESARSRAVALQRRHELDGTPAPANPQSGIWRLIDCIRDGPGQGH